MGYESHCSVWKDSSRAYIVHPREVLRFAGLPDDGYVVNFDNLDVVSIEQRYNDLKDKLAKRYCQLSHQFETLGKDSVVICTHKSDNRKYFRDIYYMKDGDLYYIGDTGDIPESYGPSIQELDFHETFMRYLLQCDRLYAFRNVLQYLLGYDIKDHFGLYHEAQYFYVTINGRNYKVTTVRAHTYLNEIEDEDPSIIINDYSIKQL